MPRGVDLLDMIMDGVGASCEGASDPAVGPSADQEGHHEALGLGELVEEFSLMVDQAAEERPAHRAGEPHELCGLIERLGRREGIWFSALTSQTSIAGRDSPHS